MGHPTYSQTKKGLKFFKKKKYEKAILAFEKDVHHPLYQSVALLYLAKIKASDRKNEQQTFLECYEQVNEAAAAFAELDDNSKKKLAKKNKGGIRSSKFKSQKKIIQRKALKAAVRSGAIVQIEIFEQNFPELLLDAEAILEAKQKVQQKALDAAEASNSIFKLDTFLQQYPVNYLPDSVVDETRDKIVKKFFNTSEDYHVLTSIYVNHRGFITHHNLRFKWRGFPDRLLMSFLDTYGAGQLPMFIDDHPGHWVSTDCWVNDFIDAYLKGTANALLEFLADHPLTRLDQLALQSISAKALKEETLSPKAQKKWDTIKLGHTLKNQIKSREIGDNFYTNLMDYIAEAAPTRSAFKLMKKGLQYYIVTKQWDKAVQLTEQSQPFFPDDYSESCWSNFVRRQKWFNTALTILRRPHSGLSLEAFEVVNTSDGEEHSPVLSADGSEFFFAASFENNPKAGEDVYSVKYNFETKTWGEPKVVPNLSGKGNQGPLSITSNGDVMLVFVNKKLHLSRLTAQGWSKPQPFATDIMKAFEWIGKASLSSNGQVLIFEATKKIKGLKYNTNINLYASIKDEEGNWSIPFSLGRDINTYGLERSPFLHLDNETLYFSSNGNQHPSLDNMDIFVTKRLDDTWRRWSKPKNLGKEINTLEDDWGYNFSSTVSGHSAYLSSDSDINETSDIFQTTLPAFAQPEPRVPLSISLKQEGNQPIVTTVIIENLETGEILDKITTRPDGTGTFIPPPGIRVKYYTADTTLFPISRVVDLRTNNLERVVDEPVDVLTVDEMIKTGKSAPLNHLMFDHDKYDLKASAKRDIEKVYHLVAHKDWILAIEGHTDSEGKADYNKTLSLERAESVKDYLIALGISEDRLQARGFGLEYPVADNATEAGRLKNRRVEIRFLKPATGN